MIERIKYIIFCISVVLIIGSCARFGTPEGGPRDQSPPVIVSEGSEANYQTLFLKREFEFEFNEWIKLQNPTKEVVVSPPTNYPVKVSDKGKRVIFEFSEDEVLKENTTYQINFGSAIQDFTEGNIYENFIFVFSTGNVIDSLSVEGTVKDVLTQSGEEGVLVVLYDDLSDTCFTTSKPYYFTKTDAAGKFKLSNLRNDTFQMFALKDANVNYYYDLPAEKVGFLDSLLITSDSTNVGLEIELFDEEDDPRLISYKQAEKGLIKVNYFPLPFEYEVDFEKEDSLKTFTEELKDTLFIWHNKLGLDTSSIYIALEQRTDTIQNKKSKKSIADRLLALDKQQKKQMSILASDSLEITFNKGLDSIDRSLLSLADTTKALNLRDNAIHNRSVKFWFDSLKVNQNYKLELLPNAITDWFGKTNEDTLVFRVNVINSEKLGAINLNFLGAEGRKYVIDLILNDKTVQQFNIYDEETKELKNLNPGKYKLKIVEDANDDGRWSPGLIKSKRHSEKIRELPLEDVKPNWDFELDVNLKEIFYGIEGN